MPAITDESYLMRLKKVGFPDDVIAERLGITVQQVAEIYERHIREAAQIPKNGMDDMIAQFNMMCYQYQLIGESLKAFAGLLNRRVSPEEMLKTLEECKKNELSKDSELAVNILSSYIVLHPFQPINPQEALEAALQGN